MSKHPNSVHVPRILEVDSVIFPTDQEPPDDAKMMWIPESFAVAKSQDDARLERVEGYHVPQDVRAAIMLCLTEDLMVDRNHAENLPVAECNLAREGKRFSRHPLHDTFLGKRQHGLQDEDYAKIRRGSLVAEIDQATEGMPPRKQQRRFIADMIPRIQMAFTSKQKDLEREWTSTARTVKESRKKREEESRKKWESE